MEVIINDERVKSVFQDSWQNKGKQDFSLEVAKQIRKTVQKLIAAENRLDLLQIGGLNLEKLKGEDNLYSIRVNEKYRFEITFEKILADENTETEAVIILKLSNHYK